MIDTLLHLLRLCPFLRGGHRQLALENLALRQPLTVYQTAARPPLRRRDRLVWVWLSTVWTRIVREAPQHLNANDQIGSGDFEPNVARKTQRATAFAVTRCFSWLRGLDLNQRPLGYEGNGGCDAHQTLPTGPKGN